jgi:MFS family permease
MLQEKKIDLEVSTKNINLSEKESQQTKGTIIPVVVAIHLAALQQLSGVNAIVVYGGDIASNATTGELSSLMPTIINFEQIIAGLLTSLLLKRLGRKSILQVGTFLEGVGCLLVCIGFFIKNGS